MNTRRNPVVPRLRYIAKNYPRYVVHGVALAWSEAVGEHGFGNSIWASITAKSPEQSAYMTSEQLVESLEAFVKEFPTVAATRFDRYLPWAAKIIHQNYKPYLKIVRKEGWTEIPGGSYQKSHPIPGRSRTALRARALGELSLSTTRDIVRRFRSIVDWAEAENIDLNRLTLTEAEDESTRWAELRSTEAMEGTIVHQFADGWTVQELTTKPQLEGEGEIMQHCVDTYDAALIPSRYRIFSLRDPKGAPHATMEWNTDEGYVEQLKGKQNVAPGADYLKRMAKFRCAYQTELTKDSFIERAVYEIPRSSWPDHIDEFSDQFLGVFSLIHGDREMQIAIWKGPKGPFSVDLQDVADFIEVCINTSLVQELGKMGPQAHFEEFEYPTWAEWGLWLEGVSTPNAVDEMVAVLSARGMKAEDVTGCATQPVAANPRRRRNSAPDAAHAALKRRLMR